MNVENAAGNVIGKWTFKSWNPTTATIVDEDLSFVGTWVYEDADFDVSYSFVSGTTGKTELPQGVKDQLPANENDRAIGTTITPTTTFNDVNVENAAGNVIGKWTFKSWNPTAATIVDEDLSFVGTWLYEDDDFDVYYSFESGTKNMTLPKAVTDQEPADLTDQAIGTQITPKTDFNDVTVKNEAQDVIGTWKFTSWDNPPAKIVDSDLYYVGTWTYTAVTPLHVTYEFKASDGSTLPYGVMSQLPTDSNDYYVNNKVTAPKNFRDVLVADKQGHIDGYWTFVSWDKADATFTDSNITFTGTWKYEKETIEYRVLYKALDNPTGTLAPEEYGVGNNGDVVDYGYLNGKGQIKAITNYEYDHVDAVTLYGPSMPMMAKLSSLFSTDAYVEVPTAVVWYRAVVTPPPASAKHILTINYVDEDGNTLSDSYTDSLESGTAYSQASPVISGYTLKDSTQETVAGTMPNEDVTVTVVYTKTAVTPNDPKEPTTPGTVTPASDKSSDTGDSWNGGLWMILLLLGTAGVITPIALRRKDPEEK